MLLVPENAFEDEKACSGEYGLASSGSEAAETAGTWTICPKSAISENRWKPLRPSWLLCAIWICTTEYVLDLEMALNAYYISENQDAPWSWRLAYTKTPQGKTGAKR